MIWIILVGVGVGALVMVAGLCRAAARDERDWEVRRRRSSDWRDR